MFTTQSYVPMTFGDQPGQHGGVLSGCTGGKIDFPAGSRVVRIEGKGVIRMGDESRHNSGNVVSVVNVPAQLTVMIMS
ncbi:hypothetical protein A3780_20410 [Kosakonia radicincitans]|nr:hypothetical protein A3780_20410 [Kosakonia radicincitans]